MTGCSTGRQGFAAMCAALLVTASALLAAGPPATGSPAESGARTCPDPSYTPCEKPYLAASGPATVERGERARYRARLAAPSGRTVTGELTVTVRPGHARVVRTIGQRGRVTVRLPRMRPGKHRVLFHVVPDGVWDDVSVMRVLRVSRTRG